MILRNIILIFLLSVTGMLAAMNPERYSVAVQPFNANKIAQAINVLENNNISEHEPSLLLLADCHLANGHLDLAVRAYESSLLVNPNNTNTYIKIALVQMKQGLYSDARSNALQATILDFDNSHAHYIYGRASRLLGVTKDALTGLEIALQVVMEGSNNQDLILAHQNFQKGKYKKALELISSNNSIPAIELKVVISNLLGLKTDELTSQLVQNAQLMSSIVQEYSSTLLLNGELESAIEIVKMSLYYVSCNQLQATLNGLQNVSNPSLANK